MANARTRILWHGRRLAAWLQLIDVPTALAFPNEAKISADTTGRLENRRQHLPPGSQFTQKLATSGGFPSVPASVRTLIKPPLPAKRIASLLL
jgi:hypothetical protein